MPQIATHVSNAQSTVYSVVTSIGILVRKMKLQYRYRLVPSEKWWRGHFEERNELNVSGQCEITILVILIDYYRIQCFASSILSAILCLCSGRE